jgi:hypothetical protein
MPWPVTHILIAVDFLDSISIQLDRKKFIIGTSFPDIRYPAKLERGQTHFSQPTIQEILSEDAFKAGILFHSLVDSLWNIEFHHQAYYKTHLPHNPAMMHTLKILQDVFVYDRLDKWGQISGYFKETIPEEDQFGAPKSMIKRWHQVISKYLSKPPQFEDIEMLEMSLPPEMVAEIRSNYQTYYNDSFLREALINLFDTVQRSISIHVTGRSHLGIG